MKKIVIIDDEQLIINGIQAMISRIDDDFKVVDTASDGLTGYDIILNKKPDIFICDIRMPGMDGLSLIESIHPLLPYCIFIIISGFQEYEYAKKALSLGVLEYLEKPITIPKLSSVLKKAQSVSHQMYKAKQNEEQILSSILESIKSDNCEQLSQQTNAFLELKRSEPLNLYKRSIYQFVCTISTFFYEENSYGKKLVPHLPSLSNLEILNSYDDVNYYALSIIFDISQKIMLKDPLNLHKAIQKLIPYINSHFNEDLSLTDLADLVHMNTAYLSTLFKEEMGISFVKYLNHIRIEEAKRLLAKNAKTNDVYAKVGFQNYRHFYDIFKKETGKTPSEFKLDSTNNPL